MGFFDFFTTGLTFATVEKYSKVIKSTNAIKYFSNDDTKMVSDYKEFNITILASAMAVIALDMNMKNDSHKKDIQTVYIGKSANFIRKVMSAEYKIPELKVDKSKAEWMFKGNIESHLCFQTHVYFEEVLSDLKLSLTENSAFYFYKYSQPYLNELTDEEVLGENRLFPYIWNLLFAKEDYDYDAYDNNTMCIHHNSYTELSEQENERLISFVKDLKHALKNG